MKNKYRKKTHETVDKFLNIHIIYNHKLGICNYNKKYIFNHDKLLKNKLHFMI